MGEATGELRVARCSWSCNLSNAPGLMDQLVGWRDMVPRIEAAGAFLARQGHFSDRDSGSTRENLDVALDVGFRRSQCRRKACVTFFLNVWALRKDELGFARCSPVNRGRWNVPYVGESSSDRDSGLTGGALDDPRVARWGGQLNLAFGPVKRLGQTWSTLVKVGQTFPNFGKCAPGPVSSQTWSNLLKLREMCSGPRLEALLMWWVPVGSDQLGSGCLVLRVDTRENPGDLMHLPVDGRNSLDGQKKAELVKSLHERVRLQIAQKNERVAAKANKGRRCVIFEPGDWVWVHMHKERFPTHRKIKLYPRGDGPFQILEKINDNAYKVDLPDEYKVSATFNVSDLSPFDVGEDSRSNPFEERGNDGNQGGSSFKDPLQVPDGPITRSRAKKIKEAMQGLVQSTWDEASKSLTIKVGGSPWVNLVGGRDL
uniref:Tf2-1-like SH3-like domain-containing protein n=1 Tax=Fagus sylvatica TaxID=28930 RepID=A0A2N9HJN7_FAGSY